MPFNGGRFKGPEERLSNQNHIYRLHLLDTLKTQGFRATSDKECTMAYFNRLNVNRFQLPIASFRFYQKCYEVKQCLWSLSCLE